MSDWSVLSGYLIRFYCNNVVCLSCFIHILKFDCILKNTCHFVPYYNFTQIIPFWSDVKVWNKRNSPSFLKHTLPFSCKLYPKVALKKQLLKVNSTMFFIFVRRFGISQFLLCKMQETLKKKNVFSYEILWKLVEVDSD